jgi:exodeoxyribonuclease VII large subunit
MAEPPALVAPRAPWGVAALLVATAEALAARFGAVAVRGELSGFSRAASGHCYFSLKDADGAPALLRCAMFRRAATLLDFTPADGQQVELRGRLGVYEARGELQMVVEAMQRVGTGALYEEFLRRRARLAAEGLFEAGRKRALPAFPRALGIVTSPQAAALRDVLTTLARRAPQVRVVIYPCLVQGAEAPASIEHALRAAAQRAEVEAVLLVRGGGSLEDLWGFNDERVVRAIAASRVPVVSGVGHETDVTLADLVADLRAATPTAAAELAAPPQAELLAQLAQQARRLQQAARRALDSRAQRLDQTTLRLGQPARGLAGQRQALQALAQRLLAAGRRATERRAEALPVLAHRLQRAAAQRLHEQALRLPTVAARLAAQDPKQVLQRGYAWVESLDGRAVTSTRSLRQGQAVRAVWADGRATAEVLSIEPSATAEPLPPPR